MIDSFDRLQNVMKRIQVEKAIGELNAFVALFEYEDEECCEDLVRFVKMVKDELHGYI